MKTYITKYLNTGKTYRAILKISLGIAIVASTHIVLNAQPADCMEQPTCDLVTPQELQGLGVDSANTPNIHDANILAFNLPTFLLNSSSDPANKACKLGKISVSGGADIVNCQAASLSVMEQNFCKLGCNYSDTRKLFSAKFYLPKDGLTAKNLTDIYGTANENKEMNLVFDVMLPIDYLDAQKSFLQNLNNIATLSQTSIKTTSADSTASNNHSCSFTVKIKQKSAEVTSIKCSMMQNGTATVTVANQSEFGGILTKTSSGVEGEIARWSSAWIAECKQSLGKGAVNISTMPIAEQYCKAMIKQNFEQGVIPTEYVTEKAEITKCPDSEAEGDVEIKCWFPQPTTATPGQWGVIMYTPILKDCIFTSISGNFLTTQDIARKYFCDNSQVIKQSPTAVQFEEKYPCLDVKKADVDVPSTADGTQVYSAVCDGSASQRFYADRTTYAGKTIFRLAGTNQCINTMNGTINGGDITTWTCVNHANVTSYQYKDHRIHFDGNPLIPRCVDNQGTGTDKSLMLFQCDGVGGNGYENNQKFTIYKSAASREIADFD